MTIHQISRVIVTFCLFIFLSVPTIGQTSGTERVKNRAEDRTNRRVDQKIDQGVDRALDKIEGLFRKKKDQPVVEGETPEKSTSDEYEEEVRDEEEITDEEERAAEGFLGSLNLGGDFEPYENPIKMNLGMDITTIDKRGKSEEVSIEYTFDTWATAMIMNSDESQVRIILDNKDGYQTIISTDKGETQAFKMKQMSFDLSDFTPDENEFTITETSNTRTIDGYSCKEYIIEHEDGTTRSWITQDLTVDMLTVTQALASQSRNKKVPTQNYFDLKGFPIESTTVSENGKETVITHFRDIKTGSGINMGAFDTTGIKVMSMGF